MLSMMSDPVLKPHMLMVYNVEGMAIDNYDGWSEYLQVDITSGYTQENGLFIVPGAYR